MAKNSDKRPEGVEPLKQSPFASLAARMPASPAPSATSPSAPAPQAPAPPKGPPRAVVRIERKGRRGKDVTIVEQLELSPSAREAWLRELKQALGTGGALEEANLVLQGDHRPRVAAWLTERGVKKVTVA